MLNKLLAGVFLNTFGILGILGNILSIIVFTRPPMKSDTNLILCGKYQIRLKNFPTSMTTKRLKKLT